MFAWLRRTPAADCMCLLEEDLSRPNHAFGLTGWVRVPDARCLVHEGL